MATKVSYVAPDALRIESIELTDDAVKLVVSAEPDGWLTSATARLLRIRAASTLPIAHTPETLIDMSGVDLKLDANGFANFVISPLPSGPFGAMFFTVEVKE
jgi:hypothetical protein